MKDYRVLNLKQVNNIRQSKSTSGRYSYDYMTLIPTPREEQCTQAGLNIDDGIIECKVMLDLIERTLGEPPETMELIVIQEFHDVGEYHEPGIIFPDAEAGNDDEDGLLGQYAYDCESFGADKWDEIALAKLRELGHSDYQPAKVIQIKYA